MIVPDARATRVRGDYSAPRVSYLAPEGPARLSGQMLRGDFLIAFNGVDFRGRALSEAMKCIQSAPQDVMLELMDGRTGFKRMLSLSHECRTREQMFADRLDALLRFPPATDGDAIRQTREVLKACRESDVRPNIVVVGPASSGKSSLVNTFYSAINDCEGTITNVGDGAHTSEYLRFEGMVDKAAACPFTVSDTCRISFEGGDDVTG